MRLFKELSIKIPCETQCLKWFRFSEDYLIVKIKKDKIHLGYRMYNLEFSVNVYDSYFSPEIDELKKCVVL